MKHKYGEKVRCPRNVAELMELKIPYEQAGFPNCIGYGCARVLLGLCRAGQVGIRWKRETSFPQRELVDFFGRFFRTLHPRVADSARCRERQECHNAG